MAITLPSTVVTVFGSDDVRTHFLQDFLVPGAKSRLGLISISVRYAHTYCMHPGFRGARFCGLLFLNISRKQFSRIKGFEYTVFGGFAGLVFADC